MDESASEDPPANLTGRLWLLFPGGMLHDSHWAVPSVNPSRARNPASPAGTAMPTPDTWCCVACHGRDDKGRDGHLKRLASPLRCVSPRHLEGKPVETIAAAMMGKPHGQLAKVRPPPMLRVLALFISRGLHDVNRLIDAGGRARGTPLRGKDICEATCISCHQSDGKAWTKGKEGDRPALGRLACHRPEQVLHKIRNGVPGANLLSLCFLPLVHIADIPACLQTLDPDGTPPKSGIFRP